MTLTPKPTPNKPAPTKAAIAKKPQTMKFLGALEGAPAFTADNMDAVKLRDLNFKVDPEFHTKFKMTAAASGKSMKELLEEAFDLWVDSRRGR